MSKQITVKHAYNLKYYTPKLWEKVILFFLPIQTHEQDGVILQFKYFHHRMYVYGVRKVTYLLPEPSNGGVNKPWTN